MNTSIYLQLISLNKTNNNHFLKRYVKLVSFYKERNWSKQFGLHEHHILPESFGGPDTTENLVCITIREHFILHWILYKAFPKSQMTTAFHMMCHCWGKDFKISSKVYANAMLEFIERQRETQNRMVKEGIHPFCDGEKARERANKRVEDGKHNWQDKEKARERENKKVAEGRHHFSGPEINRKRLEDGTHPFQDKEKVRERNLKRVAEGRHPFCDSEFQRQIQNKRVENGTHPSQIKKVCPHCNREFGLGQFAQFHGDKCKLNPFFKEEIKIKPEPKPKIECPHCNKEFSKQNYKQRHGDKCKLK